MSELIAKIHIHPLFWLVLGLGVATGRFLEVVLLFFIVFVHELGHAVAALLFGWRLKTIFLLPFGGVAEVEEYGNRPLVEEAIVILAGPLQHLILVMLAYLTYYLGWIDRELLTLFLSYNWMIFFFNLLPIWPLDGGKLLFLLISALLPFKRSHQLSLKLSFSLLLVGAVFMGLTFPFQMNLWVIFIFLVVSLHRERKQHPFLMIRFLLERYAKPQLSIGKPLKVITANRSEKLLPVFYRFYRTKRHEIADYHCDDIRLSEAELLTVYFQEKRTSCTFGELIT